MRAGQLRHRLTIQTFGEGEDATGTPTQDWTDVRPVYGRVQPLTGRELTDARAISPRINFLITLRYCADLTTAHRLRLGQRFFDIISVANVDERNRETVVLAAEVP